MTKHNPVSMFIAYIAGVLQYNITQGQVESALSEFYRAFLNGICDAIHNARRAASDSLYRLSNRLATPVPMVMVPLTTAPLEQEEIVLTLTLPTPTCAMCSTPIDGEPIRCGTDNLCQTCNEWFLPVKAQPKPERSLTVKVTEETPTATAEEVPHLRITKGKRNTHLLVSDPVPGELYYYKVGRRWKLKTAPQLETLAA